MHTVHLPQHTTLFTVLRKPTIFIKALCLLLLAGFLGIEGAKGQISENFQSWTSKASYTAALSQSGSGGTWTAVANAAIVAPSGSASGTGSTGYVQIASGGTFALVLPNIATGGVGTITLQARVSSASSASFTVDKNVNGAGWTTVSTFSTLTTTGAQYQATINDASANIQLRITNTSSTRTLYIHDLTTTTAAPTLTSATLASALSNTYGTASTGVSFTASGTNLTANITATAQTGYEVSTTLGSGYGSSVSVATGTTVYVRNAATKAAGTTNSATAVVLSSTGATNVNVSTSASGNTVSTASLTITGITANNKTYDGTTTATLSGTAAYSGLVNGESFTVTGTPSANFSDAAVGNGKTVTVTGYTAPSANYTVTQPTLTANITAAASPTIGISGTPLNAVSTTYGTASATPTTFSVSGAGLTNDIVINALSGFEYSTTLGSGYATSLTLTQSGGVVNATTIYVRLAATTAVGTYSGNISVTSTGATTQNVATISSNVSAKALTITGLSATNKTYDGTTTVSVTGTAAYSGLVNSESFTVTGTPSYAFATASVGTAKSITVSGFTAPSSNYTVSQPSLTANITVASLSITASAQTKNFGTTSVTTGATSFTSSGLVNSETIGSVTLAYSGSPAGNLATATAGTYTITPSAATGGTFTASNYSITYNTGTLTINAVVASAPTITSITPGNGQLSVAFTAPSSTGGTTITNYKYSTNGGSTFTAVSPSQTTSPIVITGLTNNTTYSVQLLAVNSAGDGAASSSTSGTPSLYCNSTGPSSQGSDYFTNFTTTGGISNISNTSTYSSNGYGNFLLQSVSQYQGGTVNYSATSPGISNGSTFSIFVDWNQNGDFTDAGDNVIALGAGTQITSNPSGSFTVPAGATVGNTRMRIIIKDATGAISSCNTALANSETEDYTFTVVAASTPPTLSAAVGATVDNAFDVTFADNSAWRAAITGITVGGTTLTAGYTVSAGKITFNSATSSPAALLQTSGSKSIVVIATGYANATLTQNIGTGVGVQLINNTAPAAPATNGAVLATQPKVNITDLYGNIITTDNSTVVTVAATQGTWTLGGTLTATASSGVVTFSGLTASSASAVSNATLTFSASGLGTLTSGTFNIPAPDYISVTSLGTTYSENFNSLTTSSTSISGIIGFLYQRSSTPSWSSGSASGFANSNSGSPTTGSNYIWGNSAGNDFSVGAMTSSGYASPNSVMAKYQNNTGSTISNLTVGYDLKRYRINSASASVQFFYSLDGSTWTSVTAGDIATSSLPTGSNLYSFDPTGTPSATNQGVISLSNISITGLSISNGSSVYLRWNLNTTGASSQGLGIDNVTLKACNNLPATSNLSAAGATTLTGNGAVVTVSSTTLATGTYTVTYTVSGTNTVTTSTASMSFTAGSPGTGTFTTSTLASAGSANVVNISAIAFSSVTGCPSTVSTSTAAFSTVTATATITNTSFAQFTTQSLARNTTNNPVSRFKVDVTNGTTVLSALSFSTPNNSSTNNYVGGTDVNNFKLWYGTTTTFASATQIGTTQTAVNNNPSAGETVSFSSLATSLPIGTYYFWVSADVLATATSGRTITVNAPSITLSTGTSAGSTTNTGTQTFIAGTATNYYLNASNASTAGNWFTGTGGTGTALSSLTASDVNLIVDDETNATINGDLTLGNNSKIIVSQGVTAKLTIAGVGVTGTIDVGSAGTLVITSSTIPTLGTLATGSTVTYDLAGNQSSTSAASYGNVTLGGSGVKTLANAVSLTGTLTIPSGVTLDASNTVLSGTGSINVQAGATLIVGNVNGINGFNTTSGGAASSYSTGANYTFNGTSSQILGAALPSTVNNLTISNGNPAIALNGSTTVNGALTLSGGTKLVIGGSNTLTLNGTFSGNGTNSIIGSTSSNLTIGGSGTFGTLYFDQTSNATKTLNNFIINRTTSGTVSLGNGLRLVGELTPTAGVLTTNSNLRLLSSAVGTSAAIGIGSSLGGYISGTVDVERYSQAQRGYRTFAHPYASAQSVSQFTDNFQVTGLTSGALGTYGVGGSSNPSAFYYDGTKPAGNAYVLGRITKSDTLAWGVGKGLYVFVRGNGSEGTGGTYSAGISPVTLDVTNASINQGDITVSLTPYAEGADNFTLVGNPYPCPINLSSVTGISSFGTIYLQNPTYSAGSTTSLRGGFEATSSKNIVIPSMGCFYIQSTASTPSSITFHESDKVGSGTSSYAVFGTGTPKPTLGLEISTNVGFMDRTTIAFDANASSAATDFYDAGKLGNNLVTFYSLSSERKALGIDYRKINTTEIIPLGIQTTVATNYTIKLSELSNLPNTQLVLRDKLLKTETVLSQVGDSYSFAITADTATKGENRFEIGLLGTTVLPVQIADITAQLQANKTVAVNWTSTTEVNLAKYNVQRSKDGSNFSTVGTVAAKGASAYSYNDDLSTAGILPATIYYRLEAVDKDGSKTFSKVVAVALGSNLAKVAINIYPNPVQATLYAQVTVTKAGAAQLRVVDAQGKVVATQKTQLGVGTTSVSIPAAQLAAGNYVLEIDSADGKQTQRFVKE